MLCPTCKVEVPDAAFCGACGSKVNQAAADLPADPLRDALVSAVGSQYEIVRLLGRGGMAVVYLARETALERLVAIKVLPPEMAITEDIRERFRREAKTAARLTHPNVVPLYSFGDADHMLYFVMGFIQGESLGQLMKRHGKMPEHTTREILASLASALDYAHKQGVVHRDIKPDNVLIDDESGKPMLTDFGIAKAQASGGTLTEVGSIVGTPAYMSPEQAAGDKNIDGRTDIYSLGVLAYAMLAGQPPFDGDSVQEILAQHMTQEPAPIGDVVDVSSKTAYAINKCLAKDPEERWPSVAEFQKEISAGIVTATDTPEELREFESYWSSKVPAGFWASILGTLASQWWNIPWEGGIPWLFVLIVTPLFVYLPVSRWKHELRPEGVDWETMKRVLLLQPKWWSVKYPLRFRRKPDIWDRLPKSAKRARSFVFGFFSAIVLGVAPAVAYIFGNPDIIVGGAATGGIAAVYLSLGYVLVARRRLKKLGASREEIDALIGVTRYAWRASIWKRPFMKALLGDETEALEPGTPYPATAAGFANAIKDAAKQLSGAPGEIAEDALAWALRLSEIAVAHEQELLMLENDLDSVELDSLDERIAKLAKSDSEHDRKMMELLAGQADLMRQLETRSKEVAGRQEQVVELLKTLWLQVSNLRAQAAKESIDTSEITGVIRLLCEDIQRHVEAGEEADLLVGKGPVPRRVSGG